MTDVEKYLGFDAEAKARWYETNAKYYSDIDKAWADKIQMHLNPPRSANVYVMPSYQSPVTGKWVDTPSQRRDDLARTGSRPWEGMTVEKQEAANRAKQLDAELDKTAENMAIAGWNQLSEQSRTALAN